MKKLNNEKSSSIDGNQIKEKGITFSNAKLNTKCINGKTRERVIKYQKSCNQAFELFKEALINENLSDLLKAGKLYSESIEPIKVVLNQIYWTIYTKYVCMKPAERNK